MKIKKYIQGFFKKEIIFDFSYELKLVKKKLISMPSYIPEKERTNFSPRKKYI